jgi:putative colanic acid biosynthesis acetyltransferase WcaB
MLRDTLRSDLEANRGHVKGQAIVGLFRLTAAARGDGLRARRLSLPLVATYKLLVEWLLGVDLPLRTVVGPGLKLQHAYGVVIHPRTRLGAGVRINQGVTIGLRGKHRDAPVIADNVAIGAGALILGPITIGEGAVVGAGAVVVEDMPPGSVAIGPRAEIHSRQRPELDSNQRPSP